MRRLRPEDRKHLTDQLESLQKAYDEKYKLATQDTSLSYYEVSRILNTLRTIRKDIDDVQFQLDLDKR